MEENTEKQDELIADHCYATQTPEIQWKQTEESIKDVIPASAGENLFVTVEIIEWEPKHCQK